MTADAFGERIAIVMPAHNEATRIGACLESLRPFRDAGDPIVVINAASTDDTGAIAAEHGATVLRSDDRSRACAVRRGYDHITPPATLVLIAHADMTFPENARWRLLEALQTHPEAPGAFFGHRIADRRWRFRLVERGNRRRARRGVPYGDQAMVVRTAAVDAAGGFPDVTKLEDLELAIRLRQHGRWVDLECPVTIDARHWHRGVVRTTIRNWRTVRDSRRRSTRQQTEATPTRPGPVR